MSLALFAIHYTKYVTLKDKKKSYLDNTYNFAAAILHTTRQITWVRGYTKRCWAQLSL